MGRVLTGSSDGHPESVSVLRAIKAYKRYEDARAEAVRHALRHPDAASAFLSLLVGGLIGAMIGSAVRGSVIGQIAAGLAGGLFVAFCIFGSFASYDAIATKRSVSAEQKRGDDAARRC